MELKKNFGSYLVKDGWQEMQTASGEIFVYMPESRTGGKNNSITMHSNIDPYSIKEHRLFRNAIIAQIQKKLELFSNPEVYAYGKYTSKNLVMYVFKIKEDTGVETTQYYIIGEKRFCLVQTINYDHNNEIDKVAEDIADSFEWERRNE